MRNFTFLIALFLLCCCASASFAANTILQLPDGSYVSQNNPLPVEGSISIGSITVAVGEPPSTNKTTILSVSAVATTTASLANRRAITVINHSSTDTMWISLDAVAAAAALNVGIPVFPYGSFSTELSADKVLSIIAPAAATATVYQDGF